ncbi:MAG: hypothetical protein JST26_09465 [Bacteroidetes bacterium]|nr:hypothetical protein [Bacteroidota bacterium]
MKSFVFYSLLLLSALQVHAQDIIVKNDSSRTFAKVLEISPSEVRYKRNDYVEGPTIVISKNDVAYIQFSNGTTERYEKQVVQPLVLDRYNLDVLNREYILQRRREKVRQCEKLYTHKNYVGMNLLALFNNCIGIHYMRDIKKAHMILEVPLGFGYSSPGVFQNFYSDFYAGGGGANTTFKRMAWQAGLGLLFAPSMNREVNFLIGPSYSCSAYDVHTEFSYYTNNPPYTSGIYKNDFRMYRSLYGFSIGLMARFNERMNMHFLFTNGIKYDSYSQSDPFGYKYNKTYSSYNSEPQNALPYVTFNLGFGYRF